jgi:hypothetical protein
MSGFAESGIAAAGAAASSCAKAAGEKATEQATAMAKRRLIISGIDPVMYAAATTGKALSVQ